MTDDGTDHYLYRRAVPELGDGVELFVAEMIFNDRLMIGVPTFHGYRVDDYWCFSPGRAVPAAEAWDPIAQPEGPVGWKKHHGTGRYADENTGELRPTIEEQLHQHQEASAA